MLRTAIIVLALFGLVSLATGQALSVQGQYFYTKDNKPFLWLGDTAFDMLFVMTREDVELYLDDRKEKDFNVIQIGLLFSVRAGNLSNAYGDFAFDNGDITAPVITPGRDTSDPDAYDFWDHLEFVIKACKARDMLVGVVPFGPGLMGLPQDEAIVPSADAAYEFGNWLGQQYAAYANSMVWLLGAGSPPNSGIGAMEKWEAFAEGVTDGVRGIDQQDGKAEWTYTTMTYASTYPASLWFSETEWIDFHSWASVQSEGESELAFLIPAIDRRLDGKPTVNTFPVYEFVPLRSAFNGEIDGFTDDFEFRRSMYWSMFAGSAGHTYGHFYLVYADPENSYGDGAAAVPGTWPRVLKKRGSWQMKFMRQLMTSRPFNTAVPAPQLIAKNPFDPARYQVATLGEGYAMIYTPMGDDIYIDITRLPFGRYDVWWYDAKNAVALRAESDYVDEKTIVFDPPGAPARGNDWVLVIDDRERNFPPPGQLPADQSAGPGE